jgi:hypothetical protein
MIVYEGCISDQYGYYKGSTNISYPRLDDMKTYDCPYGHNTRLSDLIYAGNTIGNYTTINSSFVPEIQQLYCDATSGEFVLQFRNVLTTVISYAATIYEVQEILKATPTIGLVSLVSLNSSSDATICSNNYQPVNITYLSGKFESWLTSSHHFLSVSALTELGELPLLSVNYTKNMSPFTTLNIQRLQAGYHLVLDIFLMHRLIVPL